MKHKLKYIAMLLLVGMLIVTNNCFATNIQGTTIVTGTQKLINDVTSSMMIIGPAIGIGFIIYYLIRKMMASEGDDRIWDSRIKVAIICCIGIFVVSSLIKVIITYYQ